MGTPWSNFALINSLSMKNTQYNGWTNYETWAVNLWIDNDQGSQTYWHEQAKDTLESAYVPTGSDFTVAEVATQTLEDIIKNEHEESLPELTGFASDLLNAAMSEVNWREIASHLIAAVVEEQNYDARTETT